MSATLRTPLAMAVLSTLRERPMHPYEILHTMQERQHDRIIRLRGGSLYSTIERLERDGMILAVDVQREGRRPERTVYDLAPAGESELLEWLRTTIAGSIHESPPFASILAFLPHLMPSDAAALLRERVSRLETEAADHRSLLAGPYWSGMPALFRIHEEYVAAMREAEMAWIRDLASRIETGALKWPAVIIDWHRRRGAWSEPDAAEPPRRE